MLPVEILPAPGGTLVLRARQSELLILASHIVELKERKTPKDFTGYFMSEALINRPARKLFEAWLRKDKTLWRRIYDTVQNELEVNADDLDDVAEAAPEKVEVKEKSAKPAAAKKATKTSEKKPAEKKEAKKQSEKKVEEKTTAKKATAKKATAKKAATKKTESKKTATKKTATKKASSSAGKKTATKKAATKKATSTATKKKTSKTAGKKKAGKKK